MWGSYGSLCLSHHPAGLRAFQCGVVSSSSLQRTVVRGWRGKKPVERRYSSLPKADVIWMMCRHHMSEVAVMTAVLSAPFLSAVSAMHCWDVHSSRLSYSAFYSAGDQTQGLCTLDHWATAQPWCFWDSVNCTAEAGLKLSVLPLWPAEFWDYNCSLLWPALWQFIVQYSIVQLLKTS